ncbi:hypothetical protein CMI37_18425 [Candidatus Pacearchaeota archaeon]|nr:hypothetical protein [Candidatus Pacearchaeota archaeon]|tara:strand:+ start:2354 stop:2596 length:243 start_codon:yes stop_codon:yes gene_type:complete
METESIGLNVIVREERQPDGKKVFIVNNEELGVADFGDSVEEAMINFKKSVKLYLDTYPEKKEILVKSEKEPLMVSRIFL